MVLSNPVILSFTGVDGRRWRFAKYPFGLSSSPAALICALAQLFSDRCHYQGISVYMDNLAVFSTTFQGHLRQIELVLDTLKNANLSVNPNKMEIGFQEIEYLGYRISGTGIRLSERHIKVSTISFSQPQISMETPSYYLDIVIKNHFLYS